MVLCAEWGWGDVKTIVQGLIQDRGSAGLCAHTTTLSSRRCIVIPSRRRAGENAQKTGNNGGKNGLDTV